MGVVDLEGVTTGYRTPKGIVKIQRNITASLEAGEFVCLLGPNGAGKSTLLRTLSALLPVLTGEIYIDGTSIKGISDSELSKKISIVLTERPSVSSMTVEQLVGIGRSPYTGFWGRLTDRDHKIVTEALRATGASAIGERKADTLSDGELQKVMIAKALAQETPVIFLDEPTAFLDFPSKVETMRLLCALAHEQGKCVMQSTHDLNMALRLADRLWLVDKNKGMSIGTPRELADNGELERFFIRPGISFNPEEISFEISAV